MAAGGDGQVKETEYSGHEIEGADELLAGRWFEVFRPTDDQWDSGGSVFRSAFISRPAVTAEHVSVIRGKDHDGVFG